MGDFPRAEEPGRNRRLPMEYYVTFMPPGKMQGYLRGTIWSTMFDRRDRFDDPVKAQMAHTKALKFLPKGQWKHTRVVETAKRP